MLQVLESWKSKAERFRQINLSELPESSPLGELWQRKQKAEPAVNACVERLGSLKTERNARFESTDPSEYAAMKAKAELLERSIGSASDCVREADGHWNGLRYRLEREIADFYALISKIEYQRGGTDELNLAEQKIISMTS